MPSNMQVFINSEDGITDDEVVQIEDAIREIIPGVFLTWTITSHGGDPIPVPRVNQYHPQLDELGQLAGSGSEAVASDE